MGIKGALVHGKYATNLFAKLIKNVTCRQIILHLEGLTALELLAPQTIGIHLML